MRATLYYLMKNPAIYQQVQQEIDLAAQLGAITAPVQYAAAIKLPLLCASIKEAMRLHPSVGLTMPRIIPDGGMVVDSRYLPAGYRVGMNAAVVHYDRSVFGDDASEFRPQRWLDANRDVGLMERCLLTFGGGTRTCIGKNVSSGSLIS